MNWSFQTGFTALRETVLLFCLEQSTGIPQSWTSTWGLALWLDGHTYCPEISWNNRTRTSLRMLRYPNPDMIHVDFCCGLLLRNLAAGLLLYVCHGLLLSCATQIWIATYSICATSCRKCRMLIGQLLFVYFSVCNEDVVCSVFFTLFYPSTSPNASFALISFFLTLTDKSNG